MFNRLSGLLMDEDGSSTARDGVSMTLLVLVALTAIHFVLLWMSPAPSPPKPQVTPLYGKTETPASQLKGKRKATEKNHWPELPEPTPWPKLQSHQRHY